MTIENGINGEALNQSAREYYDERMTWIGEAIMILTDEPLVRVTDVLPLPMEKGQARREEVTPEGDVRDRVVELPPEKEQALREVAGRFGIGIEGDITLEDAGLAPGHTRLLDGGMVWKIAAEAAETGQAGTIVYAGSKARKTNNNEHLFEARNQLGLSETEYDAARNIAKAKRGYESLPEPVALPFGYDLHVSVDPETGAESKTMVLKEEETSQLLHIGNQNGKPVLLLEVSRHDYVNANGENKYYQPDSAELMCFLADVHTACGDAETAVGLATSNTYAGRAIDAKRAGLLRGRQFGVEMYGRRRLAHVKDEAVAEPTELLQIPSELGVIYVDKLDRLRQVIDAQNQA